MTKVRIGLLNVQSGIGTTKGYYQYLLHFHKYFLPHKSSNIKKIAKLVKDKKIDIFATTELDRGSFRTYGINQAKILKDKSGLQDGVFYPTIGKKFTSNQGNSIHTKFLIKGYKNYKLPGLGEPRYVGRADILIGKKIISFFVTHLSLDFIYRKDQIDTLSKIINKQKNPVILAGDFNVAHEGELDLLDSSKLKKAYSGKTFPSWKPTRRLDYFFASKRVKIEGVEVLPEMFSDHRLLVAEVII